MNCQHKLKLIADARLLVIEFVIGRLFAHTHRALTESQYDTLLADDWLDLDAATIPGQDAASSDALAAEIRDAVQLLLSSARTWRPA